MKVEKIPGDPNELAGSSEHSHQVALFAALAQYAFYFEKIARDEMRSEVERSAAERNKCAFEWIHAIPNGGGRGNDMRSAMITGAYMKAEGQKRGVYDIAINVARRGYIGFDIEMKAPGVIKRAPDGSVRVSPKGELMDGRSDEQREYGKWLSSEARLGGVFDSWGDALRAILWYLGIEAHPFKWEIPA